MENQTNLPNNAPSSPKGVNIEQSNKALWVTGFIILLAVAALVTNGFGVFTGGAIQEEVLSIDHSPVIGDANAPVTIYDFSDFSCSHCAQAQPTIDAVIEEYVKAGKVKIVFKYFPTVGQAQPAHAVAYAMNEQGLFWEFASEAFARQEDISDLAKMKRLAIELGADPIKIDSFLASGKASVYTQKDTQMGINAGVSGTPTFIINGKLMPGLRTYDDFKKAIEKEL